MTDAIESSSRSVDRYIEAPRSYEYAEGDPLAVFLAGGISDCPDWQAIASNVVLDAGLIVLNPRRANYQLGDTSTAAEQVGWEYRHLNELPRLLTLFWFPTTDPAVTVQPIALFELGRATASPQRPGHHLIVGADPAYPRRADLELQLRHARPALTVYDSLEATIAAAVAVPRALAAEAAAVEADAQAWQPYDDHLDAPVVSYNSARQK